MEVQLPRLYNIYMKMGTVTSFHVILDNIFIPLFEVTVNPNSHPRLHLFLLQVTFMISSKSIKLCVFLAVRSVVAYVFATVYVSVRDTLAHIRFYDH